MFSILPKATQICELAVSSCTKESKSEQLKQDINSEYLVFFSNVQY